MRLLLPRLAAAFAILLSVIDPLDSWGASWQRSMTAERQPTAARRHGHHQTSKTLQERSGPATGGRRIPGDRHEVRRGTHAAWAI